MTRSVVTSPHRVRRFIVCCATALAILAGAYPSLAQTPPSPPPAPDPSDAFFDDTVVHEIRLDINTKDWEALETNYLANDYYPCNFKWGTQTIRATTGSWATGG